MVRCCSCEYKIFNTKNQIFSTLIVKVHPQEYQADMTAILGFVLKHDDSVNDRTEVNQLRKEVPESKIFSKQGSKLNSADDVTRRLWMDEFNVPFARPGSMFRYLARSSVYPTV